MFSKTVLLIVITSLVWAIDDAEHTEFRPPNIPMYMSTTIPPKYEFMPESTNMFPWRVWKDPLDYYAEYCRWSCFGKNTTEDLAWNPHCYPCSCSYACQAYGTCCPEKELEWANRVFGNPSVKTNLARGSEASVGIGKILREQIVCEQDLFSYSILMVSRCPFSEVNNSLIDLCEANLTFTVDKYTPVSHIQTGVTYRNIFCLQCSLEKDQHVKRETDENQPAALLSMSGEVFKSVEKWVLQISCEHYQSLYTVTTEDDFLKGASEQTDVCFVSLLAPEDLTELERCDPQFFWPREKRESTECRHRDLRLAKLCSEVDQLAFSTSHKGQNLFCVLCDGEIPFTNTFSHRVLTTFPPTSLITSRPAPISPAPIYIPPLTLLLGVSRRSQPSLPKCSNVTWWDDSGECRPAHCSPGKLIDESGKCLSAIEQIRGLGYKLSIVFEPRKQEMVTEQDINSLSNTISGVVENLSFESMSDINITVVRQNGTGYSKLKQVSVCSYFTGNDTVGRDEYESQLLKFVSQIWTVKRANGTNDSIILKPVLLGNELKDLELTDREDGQLVIELPQPQKDYDQGYETYKSTNNERYLSNNGMKFTTPPMRPFSFLTMPPQISSRPTTPISQPSSFTPAYIPKSGEIILTQSHARKISRIAQWTLKDEFIDVTHSLECPYVTVNITNITISNKLPKLNFLFMGETLQVNSEQKISVVKGRLQICISLYKKLTSPIFMRTKQSVLEHVQYYIEVICVILSVVCLLLSALTYCLFPSLRSLPGLNNLSLCVSLAVAQVCLLITARWGVNNLLPRGYCTMHAVLLHFSWLASFAWMSVCCIHMFRVFTAQSTKFTDNRSDKKRYLHYCMYGFGVPTILVIATYAINAGVTSGNSSGYNDDICFLDTSHSIWTLVLSLLAPLVLVILTNSVMFVLTVRQIVQVTNLQEQRRSRDRQGVITYVKLSTLTGLLGAVVVVAVQLNSSVLSLLTSPLMALQGVFIFVSFTCNQRVRHLYVELFGRLGLRCGKSSEKTTSTGSSTVRSSSNNPTRSQTLSTSI